MKCRSCNSKTNRILVIHGQDVCTNCGLQETAGSKVDGSLTRNSFRIREQQKQFQADFIPPHVYDKATRSVKPNKDFIQRYPNEVPKTFTNQELKSVGVTKLKGKV